MTQKSTDFLKGFQHAIVNSKCLLKIAISSFKQKQYGIASSLNVLAAEEAIKSFYLLIRHYFPSFDLPDFDDIFLKHKTKHRNLIWFSMMYSALVDFMIGLYNKDPVVYDKIILNPSNKLERDVARTLKWALKEKKHGLNFKEIKAWLSEANTKKNNGFYVDIHKNGWLVPQEYSGVRFEKEKQYTKSMHVFIEMLARDFKNLDFLTEMQGLLSKFTISKKDS